MATTIQSVHEEIAQGLKRHPAKKGLPFNLFVTALEIGGSIGLFHLARSVGASDVVSNLAGSIAPVFGGVLIWARARKFSGASAAIFSFTIISAVIAVVGSTNPKVLLYKDCAATALIGFVFLVSCAVARKPLVFYLAQRYGTDGTHEGMSIFDKMWDNYNEFRRGMYATTYLWATLFIVQAAVTALIVNDATYGTAYNFDQNSALRRDGARDRGIGCDRPILHKKGEGSRRYRWDGRNRARVMRNQKTKGRNIFVERRYGG